MGAQGLISGIGYGAPPCEAAGMEEYKMNLPAALIYGPGATFDKPQGIDIDLWYIQYALLEIPQVCWR